jgi:hypothetical protein
MIPIVYTGYVKLGNSRLSEPTTPTHQPQARPAPRIDLLHVLRHNIPVCWYLELCVTNFCYRGSWRLSAILRRKECRLAESMQTARHEEHPRLSRDFSLTSIWGQTTRERHGQYFLLV